MKKTLAFLLAIVLVFCLAAPSFAFSAVRSAQNLTVDGKVVNCDKYNIDGSNYFKLRDLAQLLNGTPSQFDVGWNGDANLVSITTKHAYTTPNGHELELGEDQSASTVVSSQTIMIDGVIRNDLTVYNIGGSNFFKLREMGNSLGFDVDFDGDTNTAIVKSVSSAENNPNQTTGSLSAEQIAEKCAKSVFLITVYSINGAKRASGSGFFISNDGLAVTNYHVLVDARDIEIRTAEGKIYRDITIIDEDYNMDLALFRVNGISSVGLPISDKLVKQGQTAYAIGSPLGLENTISQGIISNPARTLDNRTYIQISVPIDHGSSGGALLNEYGEVIGVTSAGFNSSADLNLAIPSQDIQKLNKTRNEPHYIFSKTTYPGFDHVIDYGNFSGVRLLSAKQTLLGYSAIYDMGDFHEVFENDDPGLRFGLSIAYYESLLKENGFTESSKEENKTTYRTPEESVTVFTDFANNQIEISFFRLIQFFSDIEGLPDFGWYSYMETEPPVLMDDSLTYSYNWIDYYTYNDIHDILGDYFSLLETLGFKCIKDDDNNFLFNSDNLSAGITLSNRIVFFDVRPIVNGQYGSFNPNSQIVSGGTTVSASRQEMAFNALMAFAINNANETLQGDKAYVYEDYENACRYGVIANTKNDTVVLYYTSAIHGSAVFSYLFLTKSGESYFSGFTYMASLNNSTPSFEGTSTIIASTFGLNSNFTFDNYSGSSAQLKDFQEVAQLCYCSSIHFTNWLFQNYVSPTNTYSMEDFGFHGI